MSFRRYVVRRLLYGVVVLVGIAFLIFALTRLLPGDPARVILGPRASEDAVRELREELGLEDPVYTQFTNYVIDLAQGDLGMSVRTQQPVLDDLIVRLPATLELTTVAMLFAIGLGIPLGIIAGVNKDKWRDHVSRWVALSGVSIPEFWSGIMLQIAIGAWLGLLPIVGRIADGAEPTSVTGFYLIDSVVTLDAVALHSSVAHLILPAFVLSLPPLAQIMRLVRSSMAEEQTREYIRVAHANGMARGLLVYKYMLKNSVSSALTLIGLTYGFLLGNAFVVEIVFSWPGIGRYGVNAVLNSDFNAIIGVTLLVGLWFTIVNLAIDLMYGKLDPRVRYE